MLLQSQKHGTRPGQKHGTHAGQKHGSTAATTVLEYGQLWGIMASMMPDVTSGSPTPDHRKTCKRYNVSGHAHALTFSCFRRQPFLSKDRSCQWFIEAIERAREKHAFHVWAYVAMPEHAHLLIWPTRQDYDISSILHSIKHSVIKRALTFVQREAPSFLAKMEDRQPNGEVHYRFWQRGGGYDRNIFEPATAYQQIDYLHANPVRRGLCKKAEDWTWSSAADYAGLRHGPLKLDRESLPLLAEFM
jgi:putative transposase